ncbi:MAG: hypothetical protein K2W85_06680 [Phycisphaerales bacterium]|nr:hypothetical protein [Phycisphaerales bacterium]
MSVQFQLRAGGDIKCLRTVSCVNSPRIEAERIVRLDVSEAMISPVIVHRSTTQVLSAIVAKRISDTLDDTDSPLTNDDQSRIESKGGTIALVRTTENLQTPVIVRNGGEVTLVRSTAGDIGGPRPISPSATGTGGYNGTIISAGTIGGVEGLNIRSNITATVGIKRIETTGTDPTGGIRGRITAPTLLNRTATTGGLIRSSRSFNAETTLDQLPSNALISVGSYFGYPTTVNYTSTIQVGNSSNIQKLNGQIIINARNEEDYGVPSAPGQDPLPLQFVPRPFMGQVKVQTNTGLTTINDRLYANADGSLGGGSIGVVPFALHREASNPAPEQIGPFDGVLQSAFFTTSTIPILIKSYGPFKASTGALSGAVIVEMCDPSDPCNWIDVSRNTQLFTPVFNPGTAGNASSRTIGISANVVPPAPGVYRVRIDSGKLVCKDIDTSAGNLALDWPLYCDHPEGEGAYQFRIAPDCAFGGQLGVNDFFEIFQNAALDTNHNGQIDACDLSDPCKCDWDNNGAIQVEDVFLFLNDWFNGCTVAQIPPPCFDTADFDEVGGQTVSDIFAFLNCWFASACP